MDRSKSNNSTLKVELQNASLCQLSGPKEVVAWGYLLDPKNLRIGGFLEDPFDSFDTAVFAVA